MDAMPGVGAYRRVLIVDDFDDITTTLGELVSLLGHQVCVANHGAHAIAVAREFQPDLVLLDLGMPEMDGFEVARTLRAAPGGDLVELVAMSGWGHPAAREQAVLAGFDRHLLKPVALSSLRAVLASRARRAEAPRPAESHALTQR